MRSLKALFVHLLLSVALLVPTQALASPATEEALKDILRYMDQTFLAPNGLPFDHMVAQEPTDLAILLGLSLRSQTGHIERDPALQQPFQALANQCMAYVGQVAHATTTRHDSAGNPVTGSLLVEYFAMAVNSTDFDQYALQRYGVDPIPLVHRDLLSVIAAVHALPNGQMYRPIFKDNGAIVLLDQHGTEVAVWDQGDNAGPAPDPAPPQPAPAGPIMEQDVIGTWVQEDTGHMLVITNAGHGYEGRFPNAPFRDYGGGHQGAYMTNNWQLADLVLRLESARQTDWGWRFEGRAHGANGYSENLTLDIERWDDGRIGLGFDAFVFDMRDFTKR